MSKWENMAKRAEFKPIKHAIEAGLENLVKWYRYTDDSPVYFIAHRKFQSMALDPCLIIKGNTVLDPVQKDRYIKAAWDEEYVKKGMEHLQRVVSLVLYSSVVLSLDLS
jgi:hypothetical protein